MFSSAPGRLFLGGMLESLSLGDQARDWGPVKRRGRFDCDMLRICGSRGGRATVVREAGGGVEGRGVWEEEAGGEYDGRVVASE